MTVPAGGGAFRKPETTARSRGASVFWRSKRFSHLLSPPEIKLWDQPMTVMIGSRIISVPAAGYRCPFCGHDVEGKRCPNCGAPRGERP